MKKNLLLALIVLVSLQAVIRFTGADPVSTSAQNSAKYSSWKTTPGGLNVIKNLIDERSKIKVKNKPQESMLQQSVIGDGDSFIQLFIDRGDDITVKDGYGQSLIHLTINNEDTSILKKLIKAGVDVSAADNYGITPLHLYLNAILNAPIKKQFAQEAVGLLIDAGADIEHTGKFGVSPLEMVLWRKNNLLIFPIETVKLFLTVVSPLEAATLKKSLSSEQLSHVSTLLDQPKVKEFIARKLALAKSVLPLLSKTDVLKKDIEKNVIKALQKNPGTKN